MISPFEVPDLEIKLAYDDVVNINADVLALWQANKDNAFSVKDLEAGTISYRVKLPVITPDIASRYSKVMTNLKHILDQSVNASYTAFTGESSSKLHFPNGNSEVNFNASMNGTPLNLLPKDVRSIIMKYKPFQGGDDRLYGMCKLARIKHRPIYLNIEARLSEIFLIDGATELISFETKIIDSDGCYELATAPIGANNKAELSVGYEITLLEQGPFFEENAIMCIFDLLETVRNIHREIKAACLKSSPQ